ncbi:DUF934 domain-containing protein [Acidimangrovimonas pyrenivorans]|uniref:DUF934 domain-containing protein n=1 Tax=Acidimangrovimonas pyrenivorans TaxID=2030798 RepID=A0ABV7AG08_9RHOB
MSVIVTDSGFAADDWQGEISPLAALADRPEARAVALAAEADPAALAGRLHGLALIVVRFAAYADGRGFTLGRRLRLAGYAGRLRAAGPLIADQYAMARRAGFDEVEIPDEIAARQPEEQWRFRADWRAHDYRSRLRA